MRFITILIFIIQASFIFGQLPIMDKISNEICDSLSKLNEPLEDLSLESYKNIQREIILSNYLDWKKEIATFKKTTNQEEWVYDSYYQHILQLKCKEFRVINTNFDNYLVEERHANIRPIYLKSKEFVFLLEQNATYEKLEKYLSLELKNSTIKALLQLSQKEIDKYKWTSTLSNIHTSENGNTFRVRYSDYTNRETKFQIDISFKDKKDLQIDKLEIKLDQQLKEELKRRIEFNKKIESGELELPPPPSFKKQKNKSLNMSPEKIVQKNLDAYNSLDIETFMACFHADIKMYNFGIEKPSAQGLAEVRKIYQDLFKQSPKLYSTIIKRIIFENKVIDHESITGRLGNENPIEMVLIYEVEEQKIIKITAIKK
ncbi:MAG: nuclear transport factor 2 family protein [Saprospiraceae bacterium]